MLIHTQYIASEFKSPSIHFTQQGSKKDSNSLICNINGLSALSKPKKTVHAWRSYANSNQIHTRRKQFHLQTGHSSLNCRSLNDPLVCFEISQRPWELPSLAVLLATLCCQQPSWAVLWYELNTMGKAGQIFFYCREQTPRRSFAIASLHPSTMLTIAAYAPQI